jgi:hypothetical protein
MEKIYPSSSPFSLAMSSRVSSRGSQAALSKRRRVTFATGLFIAGPGPQASSAIVVLVVIGGFNEAKSTRRGPKIEHLSDQAKILPAPRFERGTTVSQ